MKKFLLIIALFAALPAFGYSGTTISPYVSELDGKQLQWGAGNYDYFVMFKSLMSNENRNQCSVDGSVGCDLPNNPEPDTCLSQSTFRLTQSHIPEDAHIEAAYLIWTVSVDPGDIRTDNTAILDFTSADGRIYKTAEIAAPRTGTLGTDANPGQQDFTFEGIAFESNGTIIGGHYTYRVDVTDYFDQIQAEGRELGYESDGFSLYGNYTVSGIDCTNDSQYISQTNGQTTYSSTVLAGWSIITVYSSSKVSSKMVYIYNGFSQYAGQYVDFGISGFEFPDKPVVKITLAVHEGDPGFAYSTGCSGSILGSGNCPPEGLQVTGETTPPESNVFLFNECNPAKFQDSDGKDFPYSETYNSISSTYGWQDAVTTCVGGDPNNPDPDTLEYTMDVDTFLLDAGTNAAFDEQFKQGDTSMFIRIGANRDVIYTNYMVVSVSTKNNWPDPDTGDTSGDTGEPDTGDTGDSGTPDTGDTGNTEPDSGNTGDTGSSDTGDTTDTDPTDPEDTTDPKQGELGAECYPDRTCNDGLLCRSSDNTCFAPEAAKSSGCSVLTLDQDFRM